MTALGIEKRERKRERGYNCSVKKLYEMMMSTSDVL
jgi:hypothetical protein